jgi:uncharacterized protein DUF1579
MRIGFWLVAAIALAPLRTALGQETKPRPQHEWAGRNPITPAHAHLKHFVGDWDVKVTRHAEAKKIGSSATESVTPLSNGLFTLSVFEYVTDGKAFEGRKIVGYDPHKKVFVYVWVDSDNTVPVFGEGTWDETTRTLTAQGKMTDPDGKTTSFRNVLVIQGAEARSETLYFAGADGKEMLISEVASTRRKEPRKARDAATSSEAIQETLKPYAGAWDATLTMGSGTPAEKGTETCSLVCRGKWLWTRLTSNLMGTTWEAHQLLGYDPKTKRYYSVWVDSMSGSLDRAEGASADGKTRTMNGLTYDEQGTTRKWSEVNAWKDDDHRSLKWTIETSSGKPAEMEILYARKR